MQRERIIIALAAMALMCRVIARAEQIQIAEGDGPTQKQAPAAQPRTERKTELVEVVVEAKRPLSAASSDEIRAHDYELRPHATTQEILNNVPGLVVAQHQGGGKATQYLVRGFDADHGTDFAVFVDDLPVNLPTHAHGQGYADLNFLIPDTVDRLQLYKGPYFAQFGDFANAGALNIVTKDEVEENYGHAEGGSFDTQRYVAMASPRLSAGKTLLAAQAYFSNGPFIEPLHYARYTGFAKYTLDVTSESKLSVSGSVYQGDWDGSGQIPRREVQAGRLDRFGSIDPTEGGTSDREDLNLHYTYTPSAEQEWAFQVYASRYRLQLFSDFTFFRDTGLRFVRLADGSICDTTQRDCGGSQNFVPGDGIEQADQRELYGAQAKYTRYWSIVDRPVQSQIAVETRNDEVNVALHRQVQRHRFFTVNELRVEERSLAGYMQHQAFLTNWLRLETGLRGDVYFIDASNRLPAGTPILDTQGHCIGANPDPNFCATSIAGTLTKSIVSPKVSLIVTPVADTDIYLNYGNGFHSNDARNALLAKQTPQASGNNNSLLTPSLGCELGARTRQFDRLDMAAALWLLDLESELVFSGDAGMQETGAVNPTGGSSFQPAGPTRRWGVDFETRYQFTEWLYGDYDLSWADPRFLNGDAIPLAPTLLMNGGVTAEFHNGFSASFRMRYLGDRPGTENRNPLLIARGYTLFDLLAKYRWRNIEASMAFLNLTNTDWREAQFEDQTCVRREVGAECANVHPGLQGSPTANAGVDDIHFTPGNPFGVRAGLTIYL